MLGDTEEVRSTSVMVMVMQHALLGELELGMTSGMGLR